MVETTTMYGSYMLIYELNFEVVPFGSPSTFIYSYDVTDLI